MIHCSSSFVNLIFRAFSQTQAIAKSIKGLPWSASITSYAVFYTIAKASSLISPHIANNPNLSSIEERFGLFWFGASDET
jgi:hypothetical protein